MKRTLLFLTPFLLFAFFANATTSLRVQNPHQTWVNYQGNIDTAVLSIKPKGAYFECGLYLTFSAKPYNTSNSDTFEVQMPFDLPEGSFVHDSWLWVGDQIVQAKIGDRGRAQVIYEGIVQRRQDPSILYKNGPTQYELRVYPMPGSATRKVKITYMVPAKWGISKVSCPIPMNILKASTLSPYFEILSYTDNDWANPAVTELSALSFQPVVGEAFTKAVITSPYIANMSEMNYTLQSPMQGGIFSAVYETGNNEGYYQFVMLPSQAMLLNGGKKTAFLFDNEGNSTTTNAQVLSKTRQILLDNYLPTDSFNLFFSQLGIYQYSNTWVPCDTNTINLVFNYLATHNPFSNYSNMPSLLAEGINFIKDHNDVGELVLFSNTDNYNTPGNSNQLMNDVLALMGQNKIPIHVVDFQDLNLQYTWMNNQYYYGGEYFYTNLAALTGGNYEGVRQLYNYYYNTYRTFSETTDDLFGQMQGRINSFDAHADVANGFCYGNYGNEESGVVYVNKPYIKIGRYAGSLPIGVEVSGIYNGVPLTQMFSLNNHFSTDSFTRKMWMAKFMADLESGTNINNQIKQEIIDSSINSRVLSLYTAFLALEPSDTTQACNNCEDETNPGTTGVIEAEQDLVIKAFPNPFTSEITIQIHLEEAKAELKIYNTLGQLVKTFELNNDMGTDITINWNGTTDSGDELSAGIYLIILETKTGKKTMRIVKN